MLCWTSRASLCWLYGVLTDDGSLPFLRPRSRHEQTFDRSSIFGEVDAVAVSPPAGVLDTASVALLTGHMLQQVLFRCRSVIVLGSQLNLRWSISRKYGGSRHIRYALHKSGRQYPTKGGQSRPIKPVGHPVSLFLDGGTSVEQSAGRSSQASSIWHVGGHTTGRSRCITVGQTVFNKSHRRFTLQSGRWSSS